MSHRPRRRLAALVLVAVGAATWSTASTDPAGAQAARPDLRLPVKCGTTWSGQTRTDHSPKYSIDLNLPGSADYGETVVASSGGVVESVRNLGGSSYGLYIVIRHNSSWKTRYAHLSSVSVSQGQRVGRADTIGKVGSSGNSSGPHLHYEQLLENADQPIYFDGKKAFYWGTSSYRYPCS